ncbi:MAG TPA: hypothetical protein VKD90_07160, partial [Gemmataceae bacterium]|nr:hypothetical protein [Gemmataceae bacterium]
MLVPSYHRPWLVTDLASGAPMPPPDPANPMDQAVTNVTPPEAASGVTQKLATPSHFPPNVANPNPWTNAYGRLRMLRPRPVDNMVQVPGGYQSFFPYPKMNVGPNGLPDGTYGDVQNLEGKAYGQQFDSVWTDLDLPVRRFNGKNYKPLVALLIVDTDSRINLNTAGNFFPLPDDPPPGTSLQPQDPTVRQYLPPQYGHGSNQGIGRWEINPAWVMPTPIPPLAMQALAALPATHPDRTNMVFWSANEAAALSRWPLTWNPPGPPSYTMVPPALAPRYGGVNTFQQPWEPQQHGVPERRFRAYSNENIGLNQPTPGSGTHYYGQVDFDGNSRVFGAPRYGDMADGQATNLIFGPPFVMLPGPPPSPRPDPNSRYGNGYYIANPPPPNPPPYDERSHHPSMYNPYWVKSFRSNNPLTASDRVFGVEEIRLLSEKYNYGDYSSSELAALAPTTLGNNWYLSSPPLPTAQLNARMAVTTLSNDINLPGASPWLPPAAYQITSTDPQKPWTGYPAGMPRQFAPSPGDQPPPTPGPGQDFDPYYRATLAALGPVDLFRKLTDYRATVSQAYSPMNMGNAQRATQDRQELAKDIFDRLRLATTGNASYPITGDTNANRWLAQLAVNIVDFMDNDDVMTPFNWNPAQSSDQKQGWVYGFERPRLVMNETYIRIENDPTEPDPPIDPTTMNPKPSQGKFYSMRIWMELHNPLTPAGQAEQNLSPDGDDGTNGGYRARLTENFAGGGEQSVYRIVIRKVQVPVGMNDQNDPMKMRDPDNVIGTPAGTAGGGAPPEQIVEFAGPSVTHPPAGQPKVVQPNSDPAQRFGPNNSFYVIGPQADSDPMSANQPAELPPAGSGIRADLTSSNLQFSMLENVDVNSGAPVRPMWAPGFALQRLANPYMPPDPATNPYVTIDYLDPDPTGSSVYDRVKGTYDGMRPMGMQPDLNTTYSWGRRQPYDARIVFYPIAPGMAPNPPQDSGQYHQGAGGAGMGQIGGHTFKKHNAKNGSWPAAATAGTTTDQSPGQLTNDSLQFPFLPLNHLDRSILSPMELLHVAAVKPHEVTHSFHMTTKNNRRLAYTANWLDMNDGILQPGQSTFLFRAFDFLRSSAGVDGLPTGGRVAGRVNLNTVFETGDPDVGSRILAAVADPP